MSKKLYGFDFLLPFVWICQVHHYVIFKLHSMMFSFQFNFSSHLSLPLSLLPSELVIKKVCYCVFMLGVLLLPGWLEKVTRLPWSCSWSLDSYYIKALVSNMLGRSTYCFVFFLTGTAFRVEVIERFLQLCVLVLCLLNPSKCFWL